MGVVRDVTIDNLTQAVQGISSTGISDSTGQAINNTLGTLGKDTSLQGIISAIAGLGQTLGNDKANISGDNISSPATFRQNIGVNKIIVGGVLPALALNNGNIRVSLSAIKGYSNISCNKIINISMDIYGSINSVRASATLNPRILTNIIFLDFTPNITLSSYTEVAKIFCIDCEALEITLS